MKKFDWTTADYALCAQFQFGFKRRARPRAGFGMKFNKAYCRTHSGPKSSRSEAWLLFALFHFEEGGFSKVCNKRKWGLHPSQHERSSRTTTWQLCALEQSQVPTSKMQLAGSQSDRTNILGDGSCKAAMSSHSFLWHPDIKLNFRELRGSRNCAKISFIELVAALIRCFTLKCNL